MNSFHRWFCRTNIWKKALANEIIPWALKDVELGDDVLEVGPGPGMTTDILRERAPRMTSIEIDPRLAAALKQRLKGTNVKVVEGDATAMPFADGSFSGAVSFTMLHHVPSSALQDRLLTEVYRVLKPGGVFAGSDSRWSVGFHLIHFWDTMVIVDPETFAARLAAAGFTDISVKVAKQAFRFRAASLSPRENCRLTPIKTNPKNRISRASLPALSLRRTRNEQITDECNRLSVCALYHHLCASP